MQETLSIDTSIVSVADVSGARLARTIVDFAEAESEDE